MYSLKNSYGDCDKMTHSKVIFLVGKVFLLAGQQKVKKIKSKTPKTKKPYVTTFSLLFHSFDKYV